MMRPLVAALLAALLPGLAAAEEDAALRRARALLARSPIVDGHNDVPWKIREDPQAPGDVAAYDLLAHTKGHTDIPRLREGGVGGVFWSVYVPGEDRARGYARLQLEQIDIARRMIERYPGHLQLCLGADDVARAISRGRIASLLGMEGGHAIENSLGALRAFHDLGARYMTLTHNTTLGWADAAGDDPRHGGLTRFGEEVVREMNRLGMLVDLSHVSPDTMDDALRVSEAPVIFSHSSARALADSPRNVPDEILARMARNGGVVMVTFVPAFVSAELATASAPLWAEFRRRTRDMGDAAERRRAYKEIFGSANLPKATLAQVADHVEHVRRVAGVDHVGIGSDFDGIEEGPAGLEDVSRFPALFAELIRRGWSEADLRKLAQGNLLRVLREAEAVARRLQRTRPPSTATLEQLDAPRP
jgi:membrane dipeptidase